LGVLMRCCSFPEVILCFCQELVLPTNSLH